MCSCVCSVAGPASAEEEAMVPKVVEDSMLEAAMHEEDIPALPDEEIAAADQRT